MITLTASLENFMQGQDLKGLKPFAYLFRNKWVAEDESESESAESGAVGGKYVLDTTPIDITPLIVKPNTLSMTLDVNEVAQYNANNVTLTLSETHNYFVEGTPESYFPEGYQIYGSRVVLYYGIDTTNRTAIFTGRIKELPTYKPEQYQVELKLVSPLEMLKDIEAKDFSDKVVGEELIFVRTEDQKRIYETSGAGVGGFDAIYADGAKLYEGIDYELDQMNALNLPAVVTIINEDYEHATITADYYTWKTGLSVEQIIAGLVALAGYTAENTDIRSVVWNNAVRSNIPDIPAIIGIGYEKTGVSSYSFNWFDTRDGVWQNTIATNESRKIRTHYLPDNFETEFNIRVDFFGGNWGGYNGYYLLGTDSNGTILQNSIRFFAYRYLDGHYALGVDRVINGTPVNYDLWLREFGSNVTYIETAKFKVRKLGTNWYLYVNNELVYTYSSDKGATADSLFGSEHLRWSNLNQVWRVLDSSGNQIGPDFYNPCIFTDVVSKNNSSSAWGAVTSEISGDGQAEVVAYFSDNGIDFDNGTLYDLSAEMGNTQKYMRYVLRVSSDPFDGFDIVKNQAYYLDNSIILSIVNLSGQTILSALQDFALISGYEFGVDRNGVFFFKPRVASTTPTYVLGGAEVVKVDTIKKNLSDLFTKLTLNFAQIPLEFYANDGPRPNAIDKYGVINKEIDKPDIVNYDNPELAQAIGPQLLAIYADLSNILQVTGKLNLSLELGDIVNLKRNYNLVQPDSASDLKKYAAQQTYYRACKITGMNYNFAKRQITYTLRDVSNANNGPLPPYLQFTYEFPLPFGAKQ